MIRYERRRGTVEPTRDDSEKAASFSGPTAASPLPKAVLSHRTPHGRQRSLGLPRCVACTESTNYALQTSRNTIASCFAPLGPHCLVDRIPRAALSLALGWLVSGLWPDRQQGSDRIERYARSDTFEHH